MSPSGCVIEATGFTCMQETGKGTPLSCWEEPVTTDRELGSQAMEGRLSGCFCQTLSGLRDLPYSSHTLVLLGA